MNRRSVPFRCAFTLIELVLVMTVIAIALAMVAPSLRGWSKGARTRDMAEQFITLARLARTRAVSTAKVHHLTIDSARRRCVVTVQDGQQFVEVRDGRDNEVEFPDGFAIRIEPGAGGAARDFVEFLPNGRSQATRVRITGDDGDQVDIEAATSTEPFRIVQPGEAR